VANQLKTSTFPRTCYHVKFGSSASKGVRVCINRREPPKLGSAWVPPPCGRGVGDP